MKAIIIGFILFSVTLEILCWIVPVNHRGDHRPEYREALDEIEYRTMTRTGHPYFGTVYRSEEKVNNLGFTDAHDFPYQKKWNEFVVAIFGGSVAHNFAVDAAEEFAELLRKNNPGLGDKKVVVLNMAIHAFKQPQQFIVSSFFHPSIDLSINIDGFNEFREGSPEYPIEYPSNADYFLVSSRDRAREVYYSGLLYDLQGFLDKLPLWISPLAYSQSYHRLWSLAQRGLGYLIYDVILERTHPKSSKPFPLMIDRFHVWRRWTLDQSRFLATGKVPAYFFIQPNQYVPDSKVLTEKEKSEAYTGEDSGLAAWYKLLQDEVPELRRKGVRIFDLSQVYRETIDTVYIDNCCHVNKLGNLIMARAIAKEVRIP